MYREMDMRFWLLGGHLKTGQSSTGQNRPVEGERPQARPPRTRARVEAVSYFNPYCFRNGSALTDHWKNSFEPNS